MSEETIYECAVSSPLSGGKKATYFRLYETEGKKYLEVKWQKGNKTGEETIEGSESKLEKKLEKMLMP